MYNAGAIIIWFNGQCVQCWPVSVCIAGAMLQSVTWFGCIAVQNLTGLMCGHEFCRRCWCQYLTVKIMDEGMGQVGG